MTYANKVDLNQKQIVKGLRDAGASVTPLTKQKRGVPDILVGWQGRNYLLEVKNSKGFLTPDELEFHSNWRGQVNIVRSLDDALSIIGAI